MAQGLESLLLELPQPLVSDREQRVRGGSRGGIGDHRILLFLLTAASIEIAIVFSSASASASAFGSGIGISILMLLPLLLGQHEVHEVIGP
jgi:hypothetical protein